MPMFQPTLSGLHGTHVKVVDELKSAMLILGPRVMQISH